jgi:hypothetical protein
VIVNVDVIVDVIVIVDVHVNVNVPVDVIGSLDEEHRRRWMSRRLG